jgi:competence protein ComEA
MASTDDRRAALILLALTLAGLGVRMVIGRTTAPGAVAYRATGAARPERDSVTARAARLARPLARGEQIDVDVAAVDELQRLPRIGPGLALRIAQDRERHGPFGSLEALAAVPGIGPTTLDGLRPHVRFSGPPRRVENTGSGGRVAVNRADAAELATLPGIGPALAGAIVAERARGGPFRRPEDLARVRGIGPATVERLRGRIIVP